MAAQSAVAAAKRNGRVRYRENFMLQRSLQRLVLVVLVGALAPLAAAQNASRIRVMLHPSAADPGQLPAASLALPLFPPKHKTFVETGTDVFKAVGCGIKTDVKSTQLFASVIVTV